MSQPVHVLFVCLGNICRSPTAHAIFDKLIVDASLSQQIKVDSCGTGDWHIGRAPDARAMAKAIEYGYDLSPLRARQVALDDFNRYQFIFAMDQNNLDDLRAICPANFSGVLDLFLRFAGDADNSNDVLEVPDPYYGGDDGFDHVVQLVEKASYALLDKIRAKHL